MLVVRTGSRHDFIETAPPQPDTNGVVTDFLHMQVFFAVTTVVTAVIGALFALGLWRVNRILKELEHIAKVAAIESDFIRQDIEDLRKDLKEGKGRLKSLAAFIKRFTARR